MYWKFRSVTDADGFSLRFITAQEKQKQGYRKQNEVTLQRKRDLVEINMLRGHTAPIAPSENQVSKMHFF